MPEKTLAEMAKFKVFTQIPTAESMTAALDRDKLLRHQISGKKAVRPSGELWWNQVERLVHYHGHAGHGC